MAAGRGDLRERVLLDLPVDRGELVEEARHHRRDGLNSLVPADCRASVHRVWRKHGEAGGDVAAIGLFDVVGRGSEHPVGLLCRGRRRLAAHHAARSPLARPVTERRGAPTGWDKPTLARGSSGAPRHRAEGDGKRQTHEQQGACKQTARVQRGQKDDARLRARRRNARKRARLAHC